MFRRIARRLRILLRITSVVAELEARLTTLEELAERPARRRVGGRGRDASLPEPCDDCGPDDPEPWSVSKPQFTMPPSPHYSPEKQALRERAAQLGLLAPRGRGRAQ